MFDVSWGFVPYGEDNEVLSYSDIRSGKNYRPSINENDPWYTYASKEIDPFEYISAEKADVVINGSGVIHPYIVEENKGRVRFSLDNIPNYIGRTKSVNGRNNGIVFKLNVPKKYSKVLIKPRAIACKGAKLKVDGREYMVEADKDLVIDSIKGRVSISIDGNSESCYMVIDEILANI